MKLFALAAPCIAFFLPENLLAELKVEPDEKNVIASRLEGKWKVEPGITKRLGSEDGGGVNAISFRSDPAALQELPPKLRETLEKGKFRIYLAGYVTMREKESPFVLTTFRGNSVVVGNSGDAAVTLVAGKEKRTDLLFVSEGYEDKDPFRAYERVAD